MFPFATDTGFSREQIILATAAMLKVVQVDDAGTAEEIAMIRQFYEDLKTGGEENWPLFESIEPASPSSSAFPDMNQREMLLATCTMAAYADGVLSSQELDAIKTLARDLDMPRERMDQILELVKDHLLMQLSGIPDTESIVNVARNMP